MAYQALHTFKCSSSAVKGIEVHNERKITSKDKEQTEYKSHTNENIDSARTHLNIALVGDMNSNYYMQAKDRITAIRGGIAPNEVYKNDEGQTIVPKLRKDAVWTCDTVISASPEFFKEKYGWDKSDTSKANFEEMNEYFKQGVEFMQNKYGKENVLGAIVHYDETTPHMHVAWVPAVKDLNAPTGEKLSYKALSSPAQLRNLQTEFNEHVRSHGHELDRGEIDSKRQHLKQMSEKLNIQIRDSNKKIAEMEKIQGDYEAMKQGSLSLPHIDPTKSKNKELQTQNEALRLENKKLKEHLENVQDRLGRIEKANQGYVEQLKKQEPMKRFAFDKLDENKILNEYLKGHPQAVEQMKPAFKQIAAAHVYGKKLLEHKKGYVAKCDELKATDQRIAEVGKVTGECKSKLKDLGNTHERLKNLEHSLSEHRAERAELDRGFANKFKGKEKKALDSEISDFKASIGQVKKSLTVNHDMQSYTDQDFEKKKAIYKERLSGLEKESQELALKRSNLTVEQFKHLREYKYLAIKNKSHREANRSIIDRYDNDFIPSKTPEGLYQRRALNIDHLSAEERSDIKSRLEKEDMSKSSSMEFVQKQEPSRTHSRSYSQGWER